MEAYGCDCTDCCISVGQRSNDKGCAPGRWGYSFSDGSRCSVPLDCICSARSTCRTVLASGCFLDLCIFEAGSGDKSGLVRISFKEPKVDQDAFSAVIFETVPDSLATSFDIKNELHRSDQMWT